MILFHLFFSSLIMWSSWFVKLEHFQNDLCLFVYFRCTRRITDKEVLISVNNRIFFLQQLLFSKACNVCIVQSTEKNCFKWIYTHFYELFTFYVCAYAYHVLVKLRCLMIAFWLDWINYVTYFVYTIFVKRNETNCSQFMKCIVNRQLN